VLEKLKELIYPEFIGKKSEKSPAAGNRAKKFLLR